jgi:hypothetical protein
MRACPGLVVIAVVSVVGCGASVVACAVRPTAGAAVMGAVGMHLVDAISPTRTSTRTTRVRISRRVATVKHTMHHILEGSELVMVQALTSRSPVNK